MKNPIACRIGWDKLKLVADAGMKNVEVDVVARAELASAQAKLAELGLTATTVTVRMDPRTDEGIDGLSEAFAMVRALGASLVFTSAHAGTTPKEEVYARLRKVGAMAAEQGVVVGMETHPDLAQNGENARETMEAINHPNIRINFDTANVHYYNHDVDSVAELRKIVPYVSSVHLKETAGGYHSFEFPPLGQGIVNFPAAFKVLDDAGFAGPCTLELEGLKDLDPDAGFARALKECLDYLKKIGRWA